MARQSHVHFDIPESLADAAVLQMVGHRVLQSTVHRYLQAHDLSVNQWIILNRLHHSHELRMTDIALLLQVEKPFITASVRPLIAQGLIQFSPAADRRTKLLSLTNTGEQLVSSINSGLDKQLRLTCKGVDDNTFQAYFQVLLAIVRNAEPNQS